jgi:hypothetical protein
VAAGIALGAIAFRDTGQPAVYRTLGAPGAAARAGGSLVLVFDPSTPENEMRRILREVEARVVNGPTEANAYIVDVPAGRRQAALRALRSEHSVVFVEQLAPESAR